MEESWRLRDGEVSMSCIMWACGAKLPPQAHEGRSRGSMKSDCEGLWSENAATGPRRKE